MKQTVDHIFILSFLFLISCGGGDTVEEIIKAFENGTIQEAFGAGTAATIASINCIHFKGQDYFLPEPNKDFFSTKVLNYLNDYKKGMVEDKFNWLIRI